jgi:hypothetical protein
VPATLNFVNIRQLALRIDFAHTAAGVDEKDFTLRVNDDPGRRMSVRSGSK